MDTSEIIKGRRTGRTTRIVDDSIQRLFLHRSVICRDHHPSRNADERLFKIILQRLAIEHDITVDSGLIIDKNKLIIKIKDVKQGSYHTNEEPGDFLSK